MKKVPFIVILTLIVSGTSFATQPLITDDTSTQGKGKFQLEINGQYEHDKDNSGAVQSTAPAASTLTCGITDTADVSIGVPYQWIKTKDSGTTARQNGFGDLVIDVKWRFYETDGFSFAVKPGITFPTGDEDKQLGTGKITCSLYFITTRELKPWAFHVNLGYIGNQNKLDQREALWHASVAAEVEVAKGLKLVANTGIQRNSDKNSHTDPAFLLGGVVYSISENIDVDAGYKYGLTKPEVDNTVLAGITFRF